MDETGAYNTEWSKPERKTPIQYTNTYIWNLERWILFLLCHSFDKLSIKCITKVSNEKHFISHKSYIITKSAREENSFYTMKYKQEKIISRVIFSSFSNSIVLKPFCKAQKFNHLKSRRRRKWQPTPVFLPGESHG